MIRKAIVAALVLLGACSGEQPKDAGKPDGYALTMAVTAAEGSSLQRVTLPPSAIIALQRLDAGDVRIFDAEGKVVSLARQPTETFEQSKATPVKAYPISGAAAAPGASAVSVNVNVGSEINVSAQRTGEQPPEGPAALLFDTRALADPATAIQLDAELPIGQPVEVTLESSADLKNWQPLASKVLFRGLAGEAVLGTSRIALGGAMLKDRYLRASWQAAPGVSLRGGTIFTATTAPPAWIGLVAEGAALASDHDSRFALQTGYPPRAIKVTGAEQAGVVPVRLEARAAADSPWIPLAAGTLRDGKPAEIELTGFGFAEYRLVADQRSAGFSAAPRIELQYEPVVLIAAFNGKPPYTLAVGNKGAPLAYFGPGELLGDTPLSAKLPEAQVAAPAGSPVVKLAPTADDGPFAPKKMALWAALLLAVGVLAFAAVRLMKVSASPPVT
ncbi:MAG: DUF3999 family protein [Sphingomonadales bacterium]|nr:DUF3999 family protein [Sphingomonadales bacterium]